MRDRWGSDVGPIEGRSEDPERRATRALRWFAYGFVPGLVIAIAAEVIWSSLVCVHQHGNETYAIGSLLTIQRAESIYREHAGGKDDVPRYATLAELWRRRDVDSILGSGTRSGYLFQAAPSASTSEFLWFGVASPAVPTTTGDRYFCTNQTGVIYYATTGSFSMNTTDCQIPWSAQPVGK
jgi:hypothetical protein